MTSKPLPPPRRKKSSGDKETPKIVGLIDKDDDEDPFATTPSAEDGNRLSVSPQNDTPHYPKELNPFLAEEQASREVPLVRRSRKSRPAPRPPSSPSSLHPKVEDKTDDLTRKEEEVGSHSS